VFGALLAEHRLAAHVRVKADIRRGVVAAVRCKPADEPRVRELLGRHAMPVDVSPLN
jgi:hypothetical protein